MTFHLLYSLFVHIRSKSYATKIILVYNLLRSLVVCLGLIEVYHIICIIQVLYYNELTHTVNEIWKYHYSDVIMTTIASQITSLTVVYSTVYPDADQRKHQSSASLAFVWGIHRDRWIPSTNGQLRGKCFHLMTSSHFCNILCITWQCLASQWLRMYKAVCDRIWRSCSTTYVLYRWVSARKT